MPTFLKGRNDLQKESDMSANFIRQEQFKLTCGVIEAKRNDLIQLPVDELAEMFRILEGRDSSDPQAEASEDIEPIKEKLVNIILLDMMKNHHPVIEERYQFVEWLYRIRAQWKRMGLFQPEFICIIFGEMMVKQQQSMGTSVNGTHPGY